MILNGTALMHSLKHRLFFPFPNVFVFVLLFLKTPTIKVPFYQLYLKGATVISKVIIIMQALYSNNSTTKNVS